MSDETNAYWQALLDRRSEIVERASTCYLSTEEEAELIAEYKELAEKLQPYLAAQLERMAIHFRLMDRQGSIEPDYEALYRKKAELDRKYLGSDPDDQK